MLGADAVALDILDADDDWVGGQFVCGQCDREDVADATSAAIRSPRRSGIVAAFWVVAGIVAVMALAGGLTRLAVALRS